MEKIDKNVYVAFDGKRFSNEIDCIWYEEGKKQEELERKVDQQLGVKTHVLYPSMLDFKSQLKLYLIKNEQDLDLFIKTFDTWFIDLDEYREVDKKTFVYPEVLCVVDVVDNSRECRLYRFSELCNQFYAFVDEINAIIKG